MPVTPSRYTLPSTGRGYYNLPELEATVGQAILFSFLYCKTTLT